MVKDGPRRVGASGSYDPHVPELVAIICTHTPRHLRWTLLGLATQRRKADRVVVSTDGVKPDIRAVMESAAEEWGLPLVLVEREHAGIARSGQVRNNAVRGLRRIGVNDDAVLVFFDGDMFATPGVLAEHERLMSGRAARPDGGGFEWVIGWRIELTQAQTAAMSDAEALAGRLPVDVSAEQFAALDRQQWRMAKYMHLRRLGLHRLGLVKPHKPTILAANFGARLRVFEAVNGFDERFEGYGQEDDDLARRLHQGGYRAAVGVRDCVNLHLWHETRAPIDWETSPTVKMLHAPAPTRCVEGLDRPRAQGELRVHEVRAGVPAAATGTMRA